MIPEGIVDLSHPCVSCAQIPFAAVLVHAVPPGSHFRCASSQVSAAAICCSGPVLQTSVLEASVASSLCYFTWGHCLSCFHNSDTGNIVRKFKIVQNITENAHFLKKTVQTSVGGVPGRPEYFHCGQPIYDW